MVNKWWPTPYSGLPALMSCASLLCFTLGMILAVSGLSSLAAPIVIAIGFMAGLISVGREVRICNHKLILGYGFPKAIVRYVVEDVVDIFDVNELSRGKLVRYFKYHLFVFSLIMLLPVIYLAVEGLYPSPVYLPLLLLPVFLGVALQLYIMFTAESYRKLIRRLMFTLAIVWSLVGFIVGATYRELYGKSLFSDPSATLLYFTGMLLLAVSTITILALRSRQHVIIVESSDGRFYAIATASPNYAKELVKLIAKEVMVRNEATF